MYVIRIIINKQYVHKYCYLMWNGNTEKFNKSILINNMIPS